MFPRESVRYIHILNSYTGSANEGTTSSLSHDNRSLILVAGLRVLHRPMVDLGFTGSSTGSTAPRARVDRSLRACIGSPTTFAGLFKSN